MYKESLQQLRRSNTKTVSGKEKRMKYTTGDIVTGYFGKGVIVDIREESISVWTGHNVEVIDSSMYAVLKTGYRANFNDCI